MNKLISIVICMLLPVSLSHGSEVIPKSDSRVTDRANVISSEHRDKLERLIADVEKKTSVEIAVVAAESIAPYDEVSYARLIFDNWKIGKKGKDNGILVLLAVKERLWRIETGYGVEGILPDGKCGEIGRSSMVPYFKDGRYGEGLYRGVAAISRIIAKDAGVEIDGLEGVEAVSAEGSRSSATMLIYLVIFLFIPVIFMLMNVYSARRYGDKQDGDGRKDRRGGWGSGGFGGGGFGGGGFGGGRGGGGGAGGKF